MEMKKCKLGDIAKIYNGSTPSTSDNSNYDGEIVWATPKDLADQNSKYFSQGARNITQMGFDSCSTQMIPANNILMSSRAPIGLFAINTVACCTNQGFKNIVLDKSISDVDYMYYYLKYHVKEIEALGSGTTFKEVSKTAFEKYEISIPSLSVQQKIAAVLSSLDDKIALNKKINAKLEAMAKRLYDYWLVQFDFPNEEGKPYKTSGGKMVWNEVLKRKIPEGWEVVQIKKIFENEIPGDWGEEQPKKNNTYQVSCIRGCDMVTMNDLPIRYILPSNATKLLKPNDFVIEISGGSPTQSTGRIVQITEEIINRFDGNVICSNFCHGVRILNKKYISYFLRMWNMFYDNKVFFNYEGKTSGLKNFQFDTFVENKWYMPPEDIVKKYDLTVNKIKTKIDKNESENLKLTAMRDRLLPLLMNGQVEVEG